MMEVLFWSLIVVTWVSYGMHVLKEYIRNHIKQEKNEYKTDDGKAKSIQKNNNVFGEWLEKGNGC